MDSQNKNDLEEEMSRFEQEIAEQLPPPPRLPDIGNNSNLLDDETEPYQQPPFNMSRIPDPMEQPFRIPGPGLTHSSHHHIVPPPPGLPHLPPLPPLPHSLSLHHSLRLPTENRRMPLPPSMPQFIPPPVPPIIMNQVPVSAPSTPVIKPPTVPLDNYDPTESLEEKNIDGVSLTGESRSSEKQKNDRKRKFIRVGGGQTWEDETLSEWDPNDFRLFCGDLGNEVTDEYLLRAFAKYGSITRAKVVRDKKTKKSKGFGFISFKDPQDYLKAMREMNGKYVGNRPIKLRKSTWKDRNIEVARKKDKEKKKLGLR